MLKTSRRLSVLVACLLASAAIVCGCNSTSPFPLLPDPGLPLNDSPEGAILRFRAALRTKNRPAVIGLLTADYGFTFDSNADPVLASKYGNSWAATDEDTFLLHLFSGFRSVSSPESLFAATTLAIQTYTIIALNDPTHSDSSAYYKIGKFSGCYIDVPDYNSVITRLELDGIQRVWLVRGNAASLRAGQSPTSDRWYIRHWDDNPQSPPKPSYPEINPAAGSSWGRVKNTYRI